MHIREGLTPKRQPLDGNCNRSFKAWLHDTYDELVLTQPLDSSGTMKSPLRACLARWGVAAWAAMMPCMIVRSACLCGGARAIDYSEDMQIEFDLDMLKINPIIFHLVSTKGFDRTTAAKEAGSKSNLMTRSLLTMVQSMDSDLTNDPEQERTQRLLMMDDDGKMHLGTQNSFNFHTPNTQISAQKSLDAHFAWLDDLNLKSKPPADMEKKDSVTANPVTLPSLVSTIPPSVTHGVGGSAVKKRKSRQNITVLQLDVLKNRFGNGTLKDPQGRQTVADLYTKDSGTLCDIKHITTWCGNYRIKLAMKT